MAKRAAWVATGAVSLLIFVRVLSAIWSLFNVPSDIAVWCAIVLLALVMSVAVVVAGAWWRVRPFVAVLVILACTQLAGCTRIGPGHVGIVVNMAGGSKGVQDYPARTGWVFYNPISESVMEYPTFMQTAVWTANPNEGDSDCEKCDESLTFTNSDQMQVAADISLAYQLLPDKVPAFYVTFRSDDIRHFTHGYLRNIAREKLDSVAGRYRIEQIMGDNAPLIAEVRKQLQAELTPIGVELKQFGFIGAPRPPASVTQTINENNQAMQVSRRKQNELAQVQADAAKVIAQAEGARTATLIAADADSKYNRMLAESLTPLLVQNRTISKWDGKLPQVSGQSGMVPMIQFGK